MADPAFPRGGVNHGRGHQPIIWPIFPKKLHENEKILGQRGHASLCQCMTMKQIINLKEGNFWNFWRFPPLNFFYISLDLRETFDKSTNICEWYLDFVTIISHRITNLVVLVYAPANFSQIPPPPTPPPPPDLLMQGLGAKSTTRLIIQSLLIRHYE